MPAPTSNGISRTPARTPRLRVSGRGLWITFLLVPPVVVMALFVIYPIFSALAYAFYDWQGLAVATSSALPTSRRCCSRNPSRQPPGTPSRTTSSSSSP